MNHMNHINTCPACRAVVSAETQACNLCGHRSASQGQPPPAPPAGGASTVVFWIVSLLFVAGVVLGLYLLVPYML